MDIPMAVTWMLIALGVVIFIFAVATWAVLFETLVEAREYFRRQNAAGRAQDAEADEWERANA